MTWTAACKAEQDARARAAVESLALAAGRGELPEDDAREHVIAIAQTFAVYSPSFPVTAATPGEATQAFRAATVGYINWLLHYFTLCFQRADHEYCLATAGIRRAVAPLLDAQRPRAEIEATARRIAGEAVAAPALAGLLEEEVGWWVRRRRAAVRRR